jgi:hypothetical protein
MQRRSRYGSGISRYIDTDPAGNPLGGLDDDGHPPGWLSKDALDVIMRRAELLNAQWPSIEKALIDSDYRRTYGGNK